MFFKPLFSESTAKHLLNGEAPLPLKTETGLLAETSEILVSREFSRIFFHFHFSFLISSRFNFTFTSRKRVKGFYFLLFTSRKK